MYLKKTEMYRFICHLCDVHSLSYPKIRDCKYNFYRGSEWIEFYLDNYFFKLYRCKNCAYLRFTIFDCDTGNEFKNIFLHSIEELIAYGK